MSKLREVTVGQSTLIIDGRGRTIRKDAIPKERTLLFIPAVYHNDAVLDAVENIITLRLAELQIPHIINSIDNETLVVIVSSDAYVTYLPKILVPFATIPTVEELSKELSMVTSMEGVASTVIEHYYMSTTGGYGVGPLYPQVINRLMEVEY